MNSGLELLADSWCSRLTAGIFLPSLATFRPSATQTRLPATHRGVKSFRARRIHRLVSSPMRKAGV